MKRIESPQNPLIKRALRLKKPSGKHAEGFLVEGDKLIREALRSGAPLECLFVEEGREGEWTGLEDQLALLSGRLLRHLSELEAAPPAIGVFTPPAVPDLEKVLQNSHTLVVLDRVQDPGNLGAIIRSCEGLGAGGLLLLKGSCSPFNPKVIRAAMGSSFRVPVLGDLDGPDLLKRLRQRGFCCAATTRQGEDLRRVPLRERVAFFLGAEGTGLAPELLVACDLRLAIPMSGEAESFNVAIATAICLYERLRQKPLT